MHQCWGGQCRWDLSLTKLHPAHIRKDPWCYHQWRLIFLEPSPKMSTQIWGTACNTAQGTSSNSLMMNTAFQKQHRNAFTCILIKYDVAHFWYIHVGCPTVKSGPKFINKLFQANQDHEVFLKLCFTLLNTDGQHSSIWGFFCVKAYKLCCIPTR